MLNFHFVYFLRNVDTFVMWSFYFPVTLVAKGVPSALSLSPYISSYIYIYIYISVCVCLSLSEYFMLKSAWANTDFLFWPGLWLTWSNGGIFHLTHTLVVSLFAKMEIRLTWFVPQYIKYQCERFNPLYGIWKYKNLVKKKSHLWGRNALGGVYCKMNSCVVNIMHRN